MNSGWEQEIGFPKAPAAHEPFGFLSDLPKCAEIRNALKLNVGSMLRKITRID